MRRAREIEPSRAEAILKTLLATRMLTAGDQSWFILGHTYARDEAFVRLRSMKNVNLILLTKPNFGWFRYLPISKPRFFLMEVLSETELEAIHQVLFDFSIFEVTVFDNRLRVAFVTEASAAAQLQHWRSLAEDDRLFIYGLDTDNAESSTGFLEIVECRKNTSPVFTKFCGLLAT
jgi:hypothetical protein